MRDLKDEPVKCYPNPEQISFVLGRSCLSPPQRNFKGVSYSVYLCFSTEITDVLKFLQAVTPTVVLKKVMTQLLQHIKTDFFFHFKFDQPVALPIYTFKHDDFNDKGTHHTLIETNVSTPTECQSPLQTLASILNELMVLKSPIFASILVSRGIQYTKTTGTGTTESNQGCLFLITPQNCKIRSAFSLFYKRVIIR